FCFYTLLLMVLSHNCLLLDNFVSKKKHSRCAFFSSAQQGKSHGGSIARWVVLLQPKPRAGVGWIPWVLCSLV
ncbi:unnamed protein product, partial [Bubo scandiacus]